MKLGNPDRLDDSKNKLMRVLSLKSINHPNHESPTISRRQNTQFNYQKIFQTQNLYEFSKQIHEYLLSFFLIFNDNGIKASLRVP